MYLRLLVGSESHPIEHLFEAASPIIKARSGPLLVDIKRQRPANKTKQENDCSSASHLPFALV
jgi:hypothetical protein